MKIAIITIVNNEKVFLPYWLKYAKKYFKNEDIYILDHDSIDGCTSNLDVNIDKIHNELYFSHQWLCDQVENKQKELLKFYDYVLFTEVDELVVPTTSFEEFIANNNQPIYRCNGYEIIQNNNEKEFDWNDNLFKQRNYWIKSELYSKPLLINQSVKYGFGFHYIASNDEKAKISENLYLIHLHYVDYNYFMERHAWKRQQNFKNDGNLGLQHRWTEQECKDAWKEKLKLIENIPDFWKDKI